MCRCRKAQGARRRVLALREPATFTLSLGHDDTSSLPSLHGLCRVFWRVFSHAQYSMGAVFICQQDLNKIGQEKLKTSKVQYKDHMKARKPQGDR